MANRRAWLATRLRFAADRIDQHGATRYSHVTFTFEDHVGMVFRSDGRGCRIAYTGRDDYERAHAEAGPPTRAEKFWLPQKMIKGQGWKP